MHSTSILHQVSPALDAVEKKIGAFTPAADNIATLERPGNQPQPSSNVPLRRDPDFVDRDGVFNQLEGKCAVLGSWTALVGLGGVG